jgi:hypothetical protein
MLSKNPEKSTRFSISNKWLALIVVLVAGLGLTVGYILIPLLEPTQTASVLVSTNNTTANNTTTPIANTTTQNITNNTSAPITTQSTQSTAKNKTINNNGTAKNDTIY